MTIDKLLAKKDKLRIDMLAIELKIEETRKAIIKEKLGVEVGVFVKSGGSDFMVTSIDCRNIDEFTDLTKKWKLPYLSGCKINKLGLTGKRKHYIPDWELTNDK